MRTIMMFLLAAALTAGAAFAHGGKSHKLLGTVKMLHENHLVLTTPDGKERMVELTAATRYEKDRKAAARSALTPGVRVSVDLTEDDKKAVKVKVGAAPAK